MTEQQITAFELSGRALEEKRGRLAEDKAVWSMDIEGAEPGAKHSRRYC